MRRVTVVSVVLFAGAVSLHYPTASGGVSDLRVIKLLSTTTYVDTSKDKPPKGASRGDIVFADSVLRNLVAQFGKRKGAIVGRDHLRMIYESKTAATTRVTARLPGGTITCAGKLALSRTPVMRVAGTGAYARASGTCYAGRAPRNRYGADSLNVYRLQISA